MKNGPANSDGKPLKFKRPVVTRVQHGRANAEDIEPRFKRAFWTALARADSAHAPTSVAVTPDGSKAYVANFGFFNSTVSVINTPYGTWSGTGWAVC